MVGWYGYTVGARGITSPVSLIVARLKAENPLPAAKGRKREADMSRRRLERWSRCGAVAAILLVSTAAIGLSPGVMAGARRIASMEPTCAAYLPLVRNDPTPTPIPSPIPSPTPSITPTPRPSLQDGNFEGDVPSPGDGRIWFAVTDGGTNAANAGFLARGGPDGACSWMFFSFEGTATIENGVFSFVGVDVRHRELLAVMNCKSISSTEAECSGREVGPYNCTASALIGLQR